MPMLSTIGAGSAKSFGFTIGSAGYWLGGITETTFEHDYPNHSANLGISVDISADGLYVVAGADDDDTGLTNAGSVYIFNKSGGSWSRQTIVYSNPRATYDGFGDNVAIDGAGNRFVASAGDQGTSVVGAAYVFTRSGSTWTQEAILTPGDPQSQMGFGEIRGSLDINSDDGSYIIVGAQLWDSGSTLSVGKFYVFKRSGTTWTQQYANVSQGFTATASGFFGCFTALNSDATYALIGARGAGGANQVTDCGLAFIWTRSGTSWSQQAILYPSDAVTGDSFGHAGGINSDGTYIVVGARNKDSGAGAAYVFTRSGSSWTQQAKITKSGSTQFGETAAINADATLIAIGEDATSNRGAVHIYARQGSSWNYIRTLTQPANDPDSDLNNNNYGLAINFDEKGQQLVIGAPLTDYPSLGYNNAGSIYIVEST
jgi:hypothetical protein